MPCGPPHRYRRLTLRELSHEPVWVSTRPWRRIRRAAAAAISAVSQRLAAPAGVSAPWRCASAGTRPFQLLGLDVGLTDTGEALVYEVNPDPSLHYLLHFVNTDSFFYRWARETNRTSHSPAVSDEFHEVYGDVLALLAGNGEEAYSPSGTGSGGSPWRAPTPCVPWSVNRSRMGGFEQLRLTSRRRPV